ncbi:hypothetical protein EXIGLDRAFT_717914 [Exidia glandulosa HHB12029]|uniref:CT20-domain-containing protein n=1 Tax=Exidia glandulosa HHB12029 TaxID=1314781 RepID=A0A165P149_EXIGL|nr:hypothetical protein EXIGLDRAFT_717914 [Exidia glandulosa HHB12029]
MTDTAPPPTTPSTSELAAFLDSAAGETTFLKAVMRARPVGVHKHFHALSIRQRILAEAGVAIPIDELWAKLESLWNMSKLEEFEPIGWPNDDDPGSPEHTPMRHPEPEENLFTHAYFQREFSLPDEEFHSLLVARAPDLDADDSPAASPSAFSVADTIASDKTKTPGRGARGRTKARGSAPRGTASGGGGTKGRDKATGSATKGRNHGSTTKKDAGESSDLTEADDGSDEGSGRESGEDDEKGKEGKEGKEGSGIDDEDDDVGRTSGQARKRAAPRARPSTTTQPPSKKRRKSNAK